MKALVGTFNQERALLRALSVVVKNDCETDGSFAALQHPPLLGTVQQVAPVHAAEALALLQRVGEVAPERLREEQRSDAAKAGEGAHDHQWQDPVDGSLQPGDHC